MLYRLFHAIIALIGGVIAFAALFLVPLELIIWGVQYVITGRDFTDHDFLHKQIAEAIP
jgi:hypothetical protein